jgi:hypothetical protein
MLQIATGKFYKHGVGRENRLRGVLFTNYRANFGASGLDTAAGRLSASSNLSGIRSLIHEFVERWEGPPASQVLVSIGADHYLKDMGAVVSFALDITCTPDIDLARRLLGDAPLAPNASARPRQYVSRIFEAELRPVPGEDERLVRFASDLLELDRKHYLAAMRAIRTYVTGLQRLGDDVDIAYALLVASMESLAQGFDNHEATWQDYTYEKRRKIDGALADASDPVAAAVRHAVLQIEHVSLARRFKEYTLNSLGRDYFRTGESAIGKADLIVALEHAYSIRSKYLHTLESVPKLIAIPNDRGDALRTEKGPVLTVQGLARVARRVILNFVESGTKTEAEDYNYVLDIPGVVQVDISPEYWIWKHEGFVSTGARAKLNGLLDLYAGVLLGQTTAFVDLNELLKKCEALIPTWNKEQRLAILALYMIYNWHLREDMQLEGWRAFIQPYLSDFDAPSVESLIVRLVLEQPMTWGVEETAKLRLDYTRRRYRANAIRLPWLLEAALDLRLAEEYRGRGRIDKARETIREAIDNHPSIVALKILEKEFSESSGPIAWRTVLLPPSAEVSASHL